MVTHWESSRRPLYVRTIWKDGQHHVILDKTKENQHDTPLSTRLEQCLSSQNTHRTSKTSASTVNLKVSSVRVLLSGIKSFKNGKKLIDDNKIVDKTNERPKTWTQTPTNKNVSYRDLNKEITFHTIQGFRPPNLLKSNTVELPERQVPEKCLLDNALSERVMIWLDLATNNASTNKRECTTLTAKACDIINNNFKEVKIKAKPVEECADCNIVDSSILKNASPRQNEDIVIYSKEEAEDPIENFYHVLTPRVSADDYKQDVDDEEKNVVKRQLHIFMPNLPKKSSDCDSSMLSSKISVNEIC